MPQATRDVELLKGRERNVELVGELGEAEFGWGWLERRVLEVAKGEVPARQCLSHAAGIDSEGLEVGEDTQTHKISTSEHALFWPEDTEFDEQSNLIRRSAGAFGELGLRQLILVPGRLRQGWLAGHQAASYTHLVTS